jgi:hypothetical protein
VGARKTLAPLLSTTVSSSAGVAAMDSPKPSERVVWLCGAIRRPDPSGIWFLVTSELMARAAASVTVSMPLP